MKSFQRLSPMPRLEAALVVLGLGSACASEIGDSCSTNVDCSPNGDRICDTAQAGGYCTIEGCGPSTCPEEAVCVRFFPAAFLSTTCNPETEDAVRVPDGSDCTSQQPPAAGCPTNDCRGDEICLSSGFCSLFSLERRFCMLSCEDDSDCRDGYQCRSTGTAGAESVPDRQHPDRKAVRFCAQRQTATLRPGN